MKKAFSVIVAALIPLAFWGCSDDSSTKTTTEVIGEELPDDIPDGTPADGGEGGGKTDEKSGDTGDGSGEKSDGKKPDGSGAPANMGFERYGTDRVLKDDENYETMLRYLAVCSPSIYQDYITAEGPQLFRPKKLLINGDSVESNRSRLYIFF